MENLEKRELLATGLIPYTTDTNTVVLYHLDESTGSTTSSDSSGNGLDLTLTDMVSPFSGTSGPIGLNGAAGPFAVTGYPIKELSHVIDNGEAALFDTSSFTIEAWLRNPSDLGYHVFQIRGGGARFDFVVDTDQLRLNVDPGNVSVGSNLVAFDPNTWYHVAVTYDQDGADGNFTFYQTKESDIHLGVVNVGSRTAPDFTPNPLVDGSSVLRVGGLDGLDDRQFNGSIDEFRWSNGVRSPSEMARTFGGGPTTFTEVASIPGSHLCWGDYNNDNWVDFSKSVVYRNNSGSGFSDAGYGVGGIWGDLNNDGFLDVFDYHALFHNDGGTGFTNVSDMLPPSLPDSVSRGAALADLNNDGYLDVYMGGYEVWDAGITYPDVILMYNPATQQYDLTWQETVYRARGVTAADFDRDGDQDVYVSNYRLQPNRLWQNDGTGNMTDVAHSLGVAGTNNGGYYGHTIGSAWGDFDNDGYLDLFVGNFSHPADYQDRPQLFRNPGAGGGPFQLMKTFDGSDWQESYASPAVADYDNDGDLDLYLTTVYSGDNPRLYRNEGNWNFTDVTGSVGLGGLGATYMAAWADYDNDGDLDLATADRIFRNNESGNSWLKVQLEGDGESVNRAAVGAQVRVYAGNQTMTRQVETSTGEANQNDLTLHFGLGSENGPVDVEIFWPDGTLETITGVEPNQLFQWNWGETGADVFVGPGIDWSVDDNWLSGTSPGNGATIPKLYVQNGSTVNYTLTQGITEIAGEQSEFCVGRPDDGGGTMNVTGGILYINSEEDTIIGVATDTTTSVGLLNISGDGLFFSSKQVTLGSGLGSLGVIDISEDGRAGVLADLVFGEAGGFGVLNLADGGSLTAYDLLFSTGWLSFADGSDASLTVTDKDQTYFESLVADEWIRIDNTPVTGAFADYFQVDGSTLSLAPPRITGDLDGDGFVGGSDLDIIRSFWGQTVTPGNLLHGDVSGNGICSGQDLDIVRAHWGEGVPPITAAPPTEDTTRDVTASHVENTSGSPAVSYGPQLPGVRLVALKDFRWARHDWAHNAVLAGNGGQSATIIKASLADIAWAYHVEQLRAKQHATRPETPEERAKDVVLGLYWP